VTNIIKLRDYQREGVDLIHDDLARVQRPSALLATGLGKTVMFVYLLLEYTERTGQRGIVLVHRDELCDQTIDKIRTIAPHLSVGKIKGTVNETEADIIVASVQTLWRDNRLASLKQSYDRYRKIGLVVVDECHGAIAPTYLKILKSLGCYTKSTGVKAVGFTATMARGDGVGLGDVWQKISFSRSLLWGIGKGHLVDIRAEAVTVESLDLDLVKRSGTARDFTGESLGQALIDSGSGSVVARAYASRARDRSGITFSPNVASAHALAESFRDLGITSAVVDGTTPRADRLKIYEDSRAGRVQVIHNCNVLTHGFDAPWISCVVPRPTLSEPLFQQMVGRITRTYPGKADGLVLAVGDVSGLQIRTLADLEPGSVKTVRPGESLAEAVVREAEEGNTRLPASHPAFALRHRDMDLFAGSASVWLRTPAGVMFIPLADGEVVLWPSRDEEGMWDVRYASRQSRKWPRLHRSLSLDMAMAWGETEAEDLEEDASLSVSRRSASWRKKKAPVTSGQLQAMKALGVDATRIQTKQQASDALSVRSASMRFDRFVPAKAVV
jgi:superfamily II DNA or RNA helicase